jgi:hypothetical protein
MNLAAFKKISTEHLLGTRSLDLSCDDYSIPRWGRKPALDIRALDIETWLGSVSLPNPNKDKRCRTMFWGLLQGAETRIDSIDSLGGGNQFRASLQSRYRHFGASLQAQGRCSKRFYGTVQTR